MRCKADIGESNFAAAINRMELWLRPLPVCQMVLDIAGDLLAGRHQLKQVVFDDRIVGPDGFA
jgi:hypothetical protein